jgi:hypothetical protein
VASLAAVATAAPGLLLLRPPAMLFPR